MKTHPTTKIGEHRQLDDDLAHFCRVHATDDQCMAALEACVTYCGQPGSDDDEFTKEGQTCVVCESMLRSDLGLS